MTTEGAGLLLTQWLSPAFPLGGFAWSQGLEEAVAEGSVTGAASLARWFDTTLHHGAGRSDTLLLAAAWRAETPEEVHDIADLARALAPSAERRAETLQQGAAFARLGREVWDLDLPDMALPVAVGRAARLAGQPLPPTATLYLQSLFATLAQAAQRLLPLGQTEAQRLLAEVTGAIPAHVGPLLTQDLSALGAFTPALDAASMRHETREPRIFRS
ncbi:urease accessory protein UreF [Histidinibacterium aquaticum]|uniref:Urease accessory protein UreF n=2 Tax=Histidinibacterium aquaticum TaxID=2613962 RepID=A0A5J5GL48_9RHOB|nr:urease accessory protein UreF [Histidinibacterium aquaticum]